MPSNNIQDITPTEASFHDQYADGKAAKIWMKFIGDSKQRTQNYKDFLIGMLRKHGCVKVLDAACGTGIDSMLLIEEGFQVVSIDGSDKMLKYALKARWEKRKNPHYDQWIIEEAKWETLSNDVENIVPGTKFDAVICLGNSFAHLLDEFGDQRMQKTCLENFAKCLKPGGLLFIDHRNYDSLIENGASPSYSVYYNSIYPVAIKNSVLVVEGKPEVVVFDFSIDATEDSEIREKCDFRLCCYPYKVKRFTKMLADAFGNRAKHSLYGDFKPLNEIDNPAFYIHVMEKPTN